MPELKYWLEESHKDLHQWFLFHQECLLLNNDKLAVDAFTAFCELINLHLTFENNLLFPFIHSYLKKHEISLRWNLNIYQKEHVKIEALLLNLKAVLIEFYHFKGRFKRLALLEILSKEQTFLELIEHHEEREEKDLFLYLGIEDESALKKEWLEINNSFSVKNYALYQNLKSALTH